MGIAGTVPRKPPRRGRVLITKTAAIHTRGPTTLLPKLLGRPNSRKRFGSTDGMKQPRQRGPRWNPFAARNKLVPARSRKPGEQSQVVLAPGPLIVVDCKKRQV